MAQKVQPQGLKSDGTLGTFRISDNNNLLVDFTPTSDDGLATAANQTSGDQKTQIVDSSDQEVDFNNIELIFPTPLQSDESAATSDTNVVTVSQTGILKANLKNTSTNGAILHVWFGSDPTIGKQIILDPGETWSDYVNNEDSMRYKSSVAGGKIKYDLLGVG